MQQGHSICSLVLVKFDPVRPEAVTYSSCVFSYPEGHKLFSQEGRPECDSNGEFNLDAKCGSEGWRSTYMNTTSGYAIYWTTAHRMDVGLRGGSKDKAVRATRIVTELRSGIDFPRDRPNLGLVV